ncbi:MAG: hypothetical protein WAT79_01190 [Saprospiraceae bacterium]
MSAEDLIFTFPQSKVLFESSGLSWNKPFLVVLHEIDNSPEHVLQLESILKAINVDIKTDVELLSLPSNQHINLAEHITQPTFVFILGVLPSSLDLTIPNHLNQVVSLHKMKILQTHTLSELRNNQEFKKHLWLCLKAHFQL